MGKSGSKGTSCLLIAVQKEEHLQSCSSLFGDRPLQKDMLYVQMLEVIYKIPDLMNTALCIWALKQWQGWGQPPNFLTFYVYLVIIGLCDILVSYVIDYLLCIKY